MNIYRGKPQGRSGQIPAFGNWDQVKELPITQYFENARQAGLKPSHSREFGDHYVAAPSRNHPPHLSYTKPNLSTHPSAYVQKRNPTLMTDAHFLEHDKKSDKNSYTGKQKRPNQLQTQNISSAVVSVSHRRIPPITKPVDEDLYQIPSEALQNSKRVSFTQLYGKRRVIAFLESYRLDSADIELLKMIKKIYLYLKGTSEEFEVMKERNHHQPVG